MTGPHVLRAWCQETAEQDGQKSQSVFFLLGSQYGSELVAQVAEQDGLALGGLPFTKGGKSPETTSIT